MVRVRAVTSWGSDFCREKGAGTEGSERLLTRRVSAPASQVVPDTAPFSSVSCNRLDLHYVGTLPELISAMFNVLSWI